MPVIAIVLVLLAIVAGTYHFSARDNAIDSQPITNPEESVLPIKTMQVTSTSFLSDKNLISIPVVEKSSWRRQSFVLERTVKRKLVVIKGF